MLREIKTQNEKNIAPHLSDLHISRSCDAMGKVKHE